jgi:glycosyltransferase involved in cell wall biosynthesis
MCGTVRINYIGLDGPDKVTGGLIYNQKVLEHLRENGDEAQVVLLPRHYPSNFVDDGSPGFRQWLANPADLVLEDEALHIPLFHLNGSLKTLPKVAIVHHLTSSEFGDEWKTKAARAFERRYLNSVDAFIFASAATKLEVESLIQTDKPSIIAYPGCDRLHAEITESEILARAARPGPIQLIYVGSLIARKGLVYLLQAMSRLPASTARLEVVGSSESEPAYGELIEGLISKEALGDRVSLRGRLSDTELARRYRENQVLAVPSLLEGYGIVYAEGMAFGLPAISSADGARAIIDEGVDGFLIEPGDVDGLCGLILRLNEDRGLLGRLSLAARERSRKLPRWEETVVRIRMFLLALSSGSTSRLRKNGVL